MTLFESLPPSYEYLITAMETMSMKKLLVEYVTSLLMDEMTSRIEKDTLGDDVTMVTHHSKSIYTQGHKDIIQLWQTRL